MLQRQIIFKYLQELQRKQQFQGLGDARNLHYINQLSSLKQASEGQFPSAVDGMPVHNSSQMLMVDKVQMMQGMQNESEIVPCHNLSMIQLGLPHSQFDVSLYGASTPKNEMNLDPYSHLQGSPDHSAKLSTNDNNGAFKMLSMQPPGFNNPLLNKQSELYSDQLSLVDESLLPNQVPVQAFIGGISHGNYSHQGMTAQRSALPLESEAGQEFEGWHELTPKKVLKSAPSDPDASLDPLEQKFLYSTDDNVWGSAFSKSIDIGLGTFESASEHTPYIDRFPTTQGGSWSALMQSAVAEISSGDGRLQEEWSGLNYQNPKILTDHKLRDTKWNHGSNPLDIQKPFDLVDHKMMVDQLNIHSYSIDSEKMTSRKNDEPVQVLLRASSDLYSQSVQASNTMLDLLNKDSAFINHAPGMHVSAKVSVHNESPQSETPVAPCAKPCDISPISLDQLTPQSYSSVPSLAMGNSCSPYHPSGHNVNSGFENQHTPASPKPTDMATKGLVYSSDDSMLKNVNIISSELPVAQTAVASVSSQHMGFLTGLASQWVDVTAQPYALYAKPQKSPSCFYSLNSESSSLEPSFVLPNEQSRINSFRQEYNVQGFCASSGKPEYYEQQLDAESSLPKCSTEMISVSRYSHEQDLYRESHLQANAVASSSMMTQSRQTSNKLELIDTESPSYSARGLKSLTLSQTKTMLHQVQSSPVTAATNARDLVLHEQKEGVNSKAKDYSGIVSYLSDFPYLDSKQWDLQEAWRAQSDKGYPPNTLNMQMLGQNYNKNCYNDNNDGCNTTYLSPISLQVAQYISKHDETLKNGQLFRTHDPETSGNTVKRFSGMADESSTLPSLTATLTANGQSSPNKFPSNVICQNITVSIPKKRKVAFDMIPWHKEVKRDSFMLQDIRMAELEWIEASNRRAEEVKNEAEILEDIQPRFRAKRRLVFATQLMQQVFEPAPVVILSSDAGSNCGVIYFAARISFADACLDTNNSQMASGGNGVSPRKLKTYKRCNASDLSEVVEGLVDKVKRLEGELLRMDKSLSIVDVKLESQELEKFSIINRFAKFHIKAKPIGTDPIACNGASTFSKTYPQRYVSAHQMPKTVPEGTGCQSL